VELQVTDILRYMALGAAIFVSGLWAQPAPHHPSSPTPATQGPVLVASSRITGVADRLAEIQSTPPSRQWTSAAAPVASSTPRRSAAPRVASAPPAPAPAVGACASAACVPDLIRQAFAPYGQTGIDWGLRVAKCESGYNPNAYNPVGPYYGVFQFLMSTFKATPYGNQNIFDASANVNAAAWKYGQGGASAWGCS
jgi:hypothetical protein